jgi:hypothetical protein
MSHKSEKEINPRADSFLKRLLSSLIMKQGKEPEVWLQ